MYLFKKDPEKLNLSPKPASRREINMKAIDLNGIWNFSFHRDKKLEEVAPFAESASSTMCVPGCFDDMPHQYCQRGCAVYTRTFRLEKSWRNGWLRIDGMGLRGKFFLDGSPLGACALPYSSFELETGALTAGAHRLTALIDNHFDAEKMKLFLPYYDFYAFGGFYHGVSLRVSDAANPPDRIQVRTLDFRPFRKPSLFAGNPDQSGISAPSD